MAINRKEFINVIQSGLRADNDFKRFLYRFQKNGVETEKVLDYSDKIAWNKTERIDQAKLALATAKTTAVKDKGLFNENSTLNAVADVYFSNQTKSKWNDERSAIYNLYIRGDAVYSNERKDKDGNIKVPKKEIRPKYDGLGKMKVSSIRSSKIDELRKSMETKGFTKQNTNGCSPRTIQKVLNQVLKPVLQYAMDDDVIAKVPNITTTKRKRKTKIVTDGIEKTKVILRSIMELFADEPFYRSLFLLAFNGRRLNEILTLEWESIYFDKGFYTIKAENNKVGEDQSYFLTDRLITSLNEIKADRTGLVFKSPRTGEKLTSPKRQLELLQAKANMPELTMHYFRHISVTTGGELGVPSSILSASLGHNNLQTVDNFYRTANQLSASKKMNEAIEAIICADDE